MKSRIVPAASGLLLCGVSLIATAQPQLLAELQMDRVAAGALPSLISLAALTGSTTVLPLPSTSGLGDAVANLSTRASAARNVAAGIQAAPLNGPTPSNVLESYGGVTTAIAGAPGINSVNGLTGASNVAGIEAGLAAVRAAAIASANQPLPALLPGSLPASVHTAAGTSLPAVSNLMMGNIGAGGNVLPGTTAAALPVTPCPVAMSSATSTLPH